MSSKENSVNTSQIGDLESGIAPDNSLSTGEGIETSSYKRMFPLDESHGQGMNPTQSENKNDQISYNVPEHQLRDVNDNKFDVGVKPKLNHYFKIWTDESDNVMDKIEGNVNMAPSSHKESEINPFVTLPEITVDCNQSSPQPSCSKEDILIKKYNLSHSKDLALKSGTGYTPTFKRGVLFSSTPSQELPAAKKFKRELDNLSVIEEVVETSHSHNEMDNELERTWRNQGGDPEEIITPYSKNEKESMKTVLQQDEISMIFEMSNAEKIERNSETIKEDDVTINVGNDLTIVYKNVEERTVDEVLLHDGNLTKEIEIVYKLDQEPDRERILEKASNLQVFVSNDKQENKDNFDPEWEVMKKLNTDDERYKAVRKLWMNLDIPDPKENLSSFNWRNRNHLGHPTNNPLPKPVKENHLLAKKRYHCTEVLDVAMQKLKHFYMNRRKGMRVDETYEHAVMASLKTMPKEHMIGGKKEFLLTYGQLDSFYQEKCQRNEAAKMEIEAIHNFYNGLKNRGGNASDLMYLSYRERQDILDVEKIITSYSSWYRQ